MCVCAHVASDHHIGLHNVLTREAPAHLCPLAACLDVVTEDLGGLLTSGLVARLGTLPLGLMLMLLMVLRMMLMLLMPIRLSASP